MRTIGDYRIYHWEEIKDSFQGSDIFLGNGFSINISSSLNYRSLFDRFLTYLHPDEKTIFREFNSTNFEGIQNSLVDAIHVNSLFKKSSVEIKDAVYALKAGLLNSIKDLHPNYSTIDPLTIHSISQKLDAFEDIYTTNYDIFLYHVLLATVDRHRRNKLVRRYQDFFRRDNQNLIFVPHHIQGFRNIYYLHGALFLFNEAGQIAKITRGSKKDELLDLIRLRIHLGQLPVFVSEGKARLKEETIARNPYLTFCRSAFRENRRPLVTHGFSFSVYDDHLIADLNKFKRRLAIGLYLAGANDGQIIRKIRDITKKLHKYQIREIKFYASNSLF